MKRDIYFFACWQNRFYPGVKRSLWLGLLFFFVWTTARAQMGETRFPADAWVIDVSQAPYFAIQDDGLDDTEAIQAALNDYPAGNRIIFFPKGEYLISSGLTFPRPFKRTVLQGESEGETRILLTDNAPKFGDPSQPAFMLRTAEPGFSADAFRNGILNLSFEVGSGNPGAIGLQFFGNNQCRIEQVTLRAREGSGLIGLDLGYTPDNGPGLIRHLTIDGFETGISLRHRVNSFTFEHIQLVNQRKLGIWNEDQVCTIRGLKSINAVPVIENRGGVLTLIDALLAGGNTNASALINSGSVYLRQVQYRGYRQALSGSTALAASEGWISEYPTFEPRQTLTALDPPLIPWQDPKQWVNPAHFGASGDDEIDDTPFIQAAIDAGAATVYLPGGKTFFIQDTLYLRGNLSRFIGCEGRLGGRGHIVFENGNAPAVVVERLFFGWGSQITLHHRANRALIWSSITGPAECISTGAGDFFMDDVVGSRFQFLHPGQRIFARQLDTEDRNVTNVLNAGAAFWVLGYKTERAGLKIHTCKGGITEVLGGHIYGNLKAGRHPADDVESPVFLSENSLLTVRNVRYFTSTGLHHSYLAISDQPSGADTLFIQGLPPDGFETFHYPLAAPELQKSHSKKDNQGKTKRRFCILHRKEGMPEIKVGF